MNVERSDQGRFRHVQMTAAEYGRAAEEGQGLCVTCGGLEDGTDPDVHTGKCHACGDMALFGVERLMLLGRVAIAG